MTNEPTMATATSGKAKGRGLVESGNPGDSGLLYAMSSLEAIDRFSSKSGQALKELATRRALAEGRNLVTAEDVINSVAEALREMIEKLQDDAKQDLGNRHGR